MASVQHEILDGIDAELEKVARHVEFRVASRAQEGAVWKIVVNLADQGRFRTGGLDESLEGANAWWPGPPKGVTDVLSVIPEADQINLRFANGSPPPAGSMIRIYPIRYLEALQACWSDDAWARSCLARLNRMRALGGRNRFESGLVLEIPPFPRLKLRRRQAEAFLLPGWEHGFLWGPPGTGKTTTLGALLAAYLVHFPSTRVLLLSTTNSAVDQALIAVDKALGNWGEMSGKATRCREKCARIGNHFLAGNYKDRKHLLPVKDTRLIQEQIRLEASRPEKEDVSAYDAWQREMDAIRKMIRKQAQDALASVRLAAMTTTRAVFTLDDLRALPPYDLVVFDEASQVGQAHALALLPLGTRAIFAGDPKQLAPIVTSDHPAARRWLGESMFREMDERAESTCLLNEQSRMAEPICRVVSEVFYKQELIVAEDCKDDPAWRKERTFVDRPPLGPKNVCVEMVDAEGVWSAKFHGPIRFESAERIRDLVIKSNLDVDESDIIVLTPFRAQRTLIKGMLRGANLKKVAVSTVHRAQGSERHTVLFDPVQADCDFLRTPDAPRLINVALSRAKARLVLLVSPGDLHNDILKRIVAACDRGPLPKDVTPIGRLIRRQGFPGNALGKIVQTATTVGRVIELPRNGTRIALLDAGSGKVVTYTVESLVDWYQRVGQFEATTVDPATPAAVRTLQSAPLNTNTPAQAGAIAVALPGAPAGGENGKLEPTFAVAVSGRGLTNSPASARPGPSLAPDRAALAVEPRPVPPVRAILQESEVISRLAQLSGLNEPQVACLLKVAAGQIVAALKPAGPGFLVIPSLVRIGLGAKQEPAQARVVRDPQAGKKVKSKKKKRRRLIEMVPSMGLRERLERRYEFPGVGDGNRPLEFDSRSSRDEFASRLIVATKCSPRQAASFHDAVINLTVEQLGPEGPRRLVIPSIARFEVLEGQHSGSRHAVRPHTARAIGGSATAARLMLSIAPLECLQDRL